MGREGKEETGEGDTEGYLSERLSVWVGEQTE